MLMKSSVESRPEYPESVCEARHTGLADNFGKTAYNLCCWGIDRIGGPQARPLLMASAQTPG
jgi:hypothetical protein